MHRKIELRQGDITRQVVDAIVNAANAELRGGGGVDGAIHRAGGPSVMAECERIRTARGGCPTGTAVATTAGRLQAKAVIHTAGPIWRGGEQGEPELLAACYTSSLQIAVAQGWRTIAFPSISTGVYGYPIERAARIALASVRDVLQVRDAELDLVRFVLFSAGDLAVYETALQELSR
jgi:O-acetyl-ADP-ribose deacetylase (regulator of RNase III)